MRIAYFDCFSGISGDMILGSFIDAGLELKTLENELKKLPLSGYQISAEKVERKGIWGTKFGVALSEKPKERNLKDIFDIINHSDLGNEIKESAKGIFSRLAEAEAKIHNKAIDEIHFHEIGATDAIIDILGAVIAIKKLGIERVYASRLHVGTGFLRCAHGTLPVPAPATLELLKGIPVYSTGVESELVTPTGAAVITTISRGFGDLPPMKIERIGYGMGSRDLSIPNALRLLIGESEVEYESDTVLLLEANIDDMNPQFYDYAMEKLFQKGAKDVFLTPIYMKKNRPGVILSIISPPEKVDELLNVIFEETTTLGVRISEVKKRRKLKRETKTITTRFGPVRVKFSMVGDQIRDVAPEYEDCKGIAREKNVPLKRVYEEVKGEALARIVKDA